MDFQDQIIHKPDQELLDIFVNSDDYQPEFVKQVYDELTKRGVTLEKYEKEKEARAGLSEKALQQGKKGDEIYIVLGFISALLGGVIGIIAGYTYYQSKEEGPNGNRYYIYDEKTRKQGQVMMIVGILVFLLLLAKLSWNL